MANGTNTGGRAATQAAALEATRRGEHARAHVLWEQYTAALECTLTARDYLRGPDAVATVPCPPTSERELADEWFAERREQREVARG